MSENTENGLTPEAASRSSAGLGAAGAVMPCGAVVTNVYEAYTAGVRAERERCARIAWDYGGNKCDSLVEKITESSLQDWLSDKWA